MKASLDRQVKRLATRRAKAWYANTPLARRSGAGCTTRRASSFPAPPRGAQSVLAFAADLEGVRVGRCGGNASGISGLVGAVVHAGGP